ncbi:M20/M25/M40 family metallo-hydrolase [Macrococcus equipercicus]|uniref:M20/M25/M40 family metallo-hydrolase n=1 Tax=Macrococcus equipercicus TaxID=69967 RepID=A0A9Q9BNS8_9STAP|nr:M20/M25/M40 family metallo-hydrolase [Macrococcus equipercicus]UTH13905.1 M20/M25/M40 family metallo-hydrolase [Macrococcus equipercicus]
MGYLWQTAADREALLKQIVKHDSITLSEGEKTFPYLVKALLQQLDYFKQHEEQVILAPTGDGRHSVMGYYKAPASKQTIVLISHYDTVGIDDFSDYQELAFDMDAVTEAFKKDASYLDESAVEDLENDAYFFGRGSMDMKPGLMLHLSLIEKAIAESWDINLVLLTVPDEEVNSLGMRTAMTRLNELRQAEGLEIMLHLNSEPTFQQSSTDHAHYVYSGSIGKIMPSVLCYGRETHVGTPMSGVSSNFMLSYINQAMEFNAQFKEHFEDEATPLPVSLMNKDLKDYYDVQTPFRSAALFNVFLFKQTAADVFNTFNNIVRDAVTRCAADYNNIMAAEGVDYTIDVPVLTYEELVKEAVSQFGQARVDEEIDNVLKTYPELYLQNIHVVDHLLTLCKSITPAVVTFFAPPYYPAVNSSFEPLIESLVATANATSVREFGRESKRLHYFNGISDLSYAKYDADSTSDAIYEHNTPSFNKTYHIPFDDIKANNAPVLNCGPIGKDAHKVTERLNKKNAFEELPVLLETLIKEHFLVTVK